MIIAVSFFYFSLKPYVCMCSSEPSQEIVQVRGHKMFLCRIKKLSLIITKYSLLCRALPSAPDRKG